jgi:hypothetical protein
MDTKTKINVNVARLRENQSSGRQEPVIRVVMPGRVVHGYHVTIHGPSRVVYDPSSAGISCWIETESPVEIITDSVPLNADEDKNGVQGASPPPV